MKNITVSVDEETHRLARIRATELDTSVSATGPVGTGPGLPQNPHPQASRPNGGVSSVGFYGRTETMERGSSPMPP